MKKQYKEKFVITIPSNKPTTGAPIGPMVGQRGLSMIDFSKQVMEITSNYEDEVPCIIRTTVLKNKKFDLKLDGVPLSYYLKMVLQHNKRSKNRLSPKDVYLIATQIRRERGKEDSDSNELISLCKQIVHSIKSFGLK
jgi:large subunit ribosomal protein L11